MSPQSPLTADAERRFEAATPTGLTGAKSPATLGEAVLEAIETTK